MENRCTLSICTAQKHIIKRGLRKAINELIVAINLYNQIMKLNCKRTAPYEHLFFKMASITIKPETETQKAAPLTSLQMTKDHRYNHKQLVLASVALGIISLISTDSKESKTFRYGFPASMGVLAVYGYLRSRSYGNEVEKLLRTGSEKADLK